LGNEKKLTDFKTFFLLLSMVAQACNPTWEVEIGKVAEGREFEVCEIPSQPMAGPSGS
jgi:hypothetical protein